MAKTYQLSRKGHFGASLKIVPVTTETETNTVRCLEVNGTDKFHITPQSALPDLTNYKVCYLIKLYCFFNIYNCCIFYFFLVCWRTT